MAPGRAAHCWPSLTVTTTRLPWSRCHAHLRALRHAQCPRPGARPLPRRLLSCLEALPPLVLPCLPESASGEHGGGAPLALRGGSRCVPVCSCTRCIARECISSGETRAPRQGAEQRHQRGVRRRNDRRRAPGGPRAGGPCCRSAASRVARRSPEAGALRRRARPPGREQEGAAACMTAPDRKHTLRDMKWVSGERRPRLRRQRPVALPVRRSLPCLLLLCYSDLFSAVLWQILAVGCA